MIVRLLALLVLLLPLSALSGGLKAVQGRATPGLAFSLASGQTLEMGALKGKVVLVNFWATWCPPCRREMPSMDRLDKMETGRPFTIVAVNVKEEDDLVERFLDEMPLGFPIALDPDGKLAAAWKAFVYPTSYLVDKAGRIRYSLNGTLEWDEPEVVDLIERLMLE
ncbi:MAG TPA: TlpA disulfide reductase family protein [Thiobacillaceae bacterium]|nr:TlpA disulfide reductase family protein [Thiobacillaceae bacterium]HNF89286.1 TlpA disulfide reductase family protein [Thiobacillaceae bacterium]